MILTASEVLVEKSCLKARDYYLSKSTETSKELLLDAALIPSLSQRHKERDKEKASKYEFCTGSSQ